MSLKYTNIQHEFRKLHKLSCNEYVLADMIYFLSTNPQSRVPGWAYKSRVSLAEDLGVSKQSILNLIRSLEEKGLVEKNEITAYLRTTETWNKVYFTDGKESLPPDTKNGKESCPTGKESLPDTGKESLPYNNNIDNNRDNTNGSLREIVFDSGNYFDPKGENEEEKVQGGAKHVPEKVDPQKFIEAFNAIAGRKFKLDDQIKSRLLARLKTYTKAEIFRACKNAHKDPYHVETGFRHLTPEFILRQDKLAKFLNAAPPGEKKEGNVEGFVIGQKHNAAG